MNKHKNKGKGAVIVMAYTSCAADIAGNIAQNCANPIVPGYTGRGILINWSDAPVLTVSGTNPRIITAITLSAGVKVAVVDNAGFEAPFTGSTTASTGDDGVVRYDKTAVLNIPLRGAAVAKDIVEPLNRSALGFLLILEKKDKVGNGSFEIIGAEQGLKANPDGIQRNEYENGGSVVATMSTRENFFETVFFDTDYATTLAAFEALMVSAF